MNGIFRKNLPYCEALIISGEMPACVREEEMQNIMPGGLKTNMAVSYTHLDVYKRQYLGRHRGVVCTPEHIVVGAGVQSLLHILCPMVRDRKNAYFYNPGFRQGRTIFEDFEFRTEGMRSAREAGGPDSGSICYLTPSQMTVWGEVMHITERMDLLKEAFEKDILIIEDDYNSEFRYYNRPTPSLQGLAGGRGVVYLGTFSRLLLPSIRMSFMVLPPELLPVYSCLLYTSRCV